MSVAPDSMAPEPSDRPLSELLTVEGYSFPAAIDAIRDSDATEAVKSAAISALEAVRETPEMLPEALENVREMLNEG